MKNQKIHEMIQLLDLKTSKEKFTTELEGIRAEIAKERSVLASLKQQNSGASPALDLVTRNKDNSAATTTTTTNTSTVDTREQSREQSREQTREQSRYCPAPEPTIPSLTPALSRSGASKLRELREAVREVREVRDVREVREAPAPPVYPGRPDYYRHMFDPSAAKVPRLCDGKNRDFSRDGIFGGGLAAHNHQSHLPHPPPPMLPPHYLPHHHNHNQPVNLSRVMEPELADKARIPPISLQQMQPIYKVGPHHDTVRPILPPPPYSLHGQIPYPPKTSEYFFARPEQLQAYHQTKRPTAIPPASSEPESKCESCLAPANFMCSACKLVHYCSASCQVSRHRGPTATQILTSHFLLERALECSREILQEMLNI